MKINIDLFVRIFLNTAAWVTCDSDENQNFVKEAEELAKQDCIKFIDAVTEKYGEEKAIELLTVAGNDNEYLAPHDFFLTRNEHGSGFWDKPEYYGSQEVANELIEIAKSIGSIDCYHIGDEKTELTLG